MEYIDRRGVVGVLLGVFFLLLSLEVFPDSTASIIRNGHGESTLNSSRGRDTSCYDDGLPYIGLIPHPSACNIFLYCIQSGSDFIALPDRCAEDYLEFSMTKCWCEFPDSPDANCYDYDNPEHLNIRMKCATLATPS